MSVSEQNRYFAAEGKEYFGQLRGQAQNDGIVSLVSSMTAEISYHQSVFVTRKRNITDL